MRNPDKYEAPKAALLMAAAALGGATVAETVSVQPAVAAIEQHETLSPKQYLAKVNHGLVQLAQEIKANPNHITNHAEDVVWGKVVKVTMLSVERPTKGHPGHMDAVGVEIIDGKTVPTNAQLWLNTTVPKKGHLRTGVNMNILCNPTPEINLFRTKYGSGKPMESKGYHVGLKRTWLAPNGETDYIDKPAVVSGAFNEFFADASNVAH